MGNLTRKRAWAQLLAIGLVLGVGMGLSFSTRLLAEEGEGRSSPSSTKKSTGSRVEETRTEKKLAEILRNQEQILANQAAILQKFDAVMEELRIIKVRASIRSGS